MRRLPSLVSVPLVAVVAVVGLAVTALPASASTGAGLRAAAAAGTGALRVESARVRAGDAVVFDYAVEPAGPKNWIGVYRDPGDGPVHQEYVGPSTVWQYVTAASGRASFDTAALDPGDYVAYGLVDDGYRWFAEPVRFTVVDDQPLHFAATTIPLRNAASYEGDAATVGGIPQGDLDGLSFRKVSGTAWVRVARSGAITGRPLLRTAGTTARAVVEARNSAGETARATVRIDVRDPRSELVPRPKVMTWNMWIGGNNVRDHHEKQLRFVLGSGVDVIGVQESDGESIEALGKSLGWDYYQAGGGHLPVRGLLDEEAASGRTKQIHDVVEAMRGDLGSSSSTPVLLTGDFNAASSLDWTPAANRCGYGRGVPWPTSVVPLPAGLTDTYRAVHPDPVADPGLTWSPVDEVFAGGYGYDSEKGRPEPQDRIDFVYERGPWKAVDSRTVVAGTPKPAPDAADNEWTSDHRAVITTLQVR